MHGLSGRVRRSPRSALPCPADGLPGVRPEAAGHRLTGQRASPDDPLALIGARLREGKIIAVKGLGGYHLACDALQDKAVRELRCRKHRDAKPLGIMIQDLDTARRLCRHQCRRG